MRAALIFAAFTCLLGSSVQAATSDTQQLLDLEQRWLTAAMQHDTAALQQILADDFVDVTYQGALRDKTDHLHSSLAPGKTKQTLEELKVRLYGDTGIVTGQNTIVAIDGSFTYRIRFTDVFVRRDSRWQAVSAQETPEKTP
ncbi:MAG TPA: nuclear transport factor 2 family protein [Gammaproteobacteria bacterium]|jgi:ketosteroid isomerase-like protein|nr:nuclear transport factor 2 family protein [Gammaproteobacteria bacterium]